MISTLYFTAPLKNAYRPQLLDQNDRTRLAQNPPLAEKADWQSSRFLKQFLPDPRPPFCLSHKKGHAVLLTTSTPCGVDLEEIRPREFRKLLPWFCTEREISYFERQKDQARAFYQLWTLKEALIKALNQDFADLKNVGLETLSTGNWQVFSYFVTPCWLMTGVIYDVDKDHPLKLTFCHKERALPFSSLKFP